MWVVYSETVEGGGLVYEPSGGREENPPRFALHSPDGNWAELWHGDEAKVWMRLRGCEALRKRQRRRIA